MTFVDDKVEALPLEKRAQFGEAFKMVISDNFWLARRGFDDNYSPDMVKLTLYREMYEGDCSRLHCSDNSEN